MIENLKKHKLEIFKQIASNIILEKYPIWKQINYSLNLNINNYNNEVEYNEMKTYIKDVIIKLSELETQLNQSSTEEEINNINW